MKFFNRKKTRNTFQFFLMIGTLAGAAAINYTIVHSPVVFVMIMALFIHELGHYFVAKKRKANPDLPYFIPLFPFIIGVTRIKDLDPKDSPAVLIAGSAFSTLFILFVIFHNLFYRLFSFVPLIMILIFEIIINYFGSDGKKYRALKSQTV